MLLGEVIESLGWTDAADAAGIDPAAALLALARAARLVRRLRGRVVVTNMGRALALGQDRAFDEVIHAVRESGRDRWPWGGHPRDLTLALLAIADGAARTLADLPDLVASGRAAFEAGHDRVATYLESSGGSLFGKVTPADAPSVTHALSERLSALSDPGAFGVVTPAMRSIARLALL